MQLVNEIADNLVSRWNLECKPLSYLTHAVLWFFCCPVLDTGVLKFGKQAECMYVCRFSYIYT